jgi:hypothetical protein
MNDPQHFYVFLLWPILIAIPLLLLTFIYGRYLRVGRGKAFLLALVAALASIGLGAYRVNDTEPIRLHRYGLRGDLPEAISIICMFLLPLVTIPFLSKLYLGWIAGDLTEAEKVPGLEGVRAWLRGGNLVCAIVLSFCLWFGMGYSFWISLLLALSALLVFPILRIATAPAIVPAANNDALSPERERVLKMLDDGKITAQESAELLNALGHSVPSRAPQLAPAPHRKMVWIGAAVLLIGFFLPWFAFNPQRTVNDAMSQVPLPQGMHMPNLGGIMPQSTTVYIAGGDIAHGLGWWVLLLGILTAALPFISTNLDAQTCQKICIVALGVGAIILLYLLTENFLQAEKVLYVSMGIVVCLVGYVLQFVGVLKERRLDWVQAA